MTRIPELEQELVAAAARLQSPRRVVRRAALAAAAVAVVLAVVGATEKDRADRGRQPPGTPSSQRGAKVGSSAGDLAGAVSTAPGTELVTGPSNVTLGGRPAKHVALTVRENVGCDPGFFYTWRDVFGGALWATTGVGDTIRVWIVDVDGTRLFIEAETTKQAVGGLEQEVQQIVESISFE